jgi:hypothetical protein
MAPSSIAPRSVRFDQSPKPTAPIDGNPDTLNRIKSFSSLLPMRWFNTAGPCQPDIHYTLESLQRIPEVTGIIEQRGYFVIHAARQTGKTTAMLTLAQALTAAGNYTALLVSAEVGAAYSNRPDQAESAILSAWQDAASVWLPPRITAP